MAPETRSYEDAVHALNSLIHLKPDEVTPNAHVNWAANFAHSFHHLKVLGLEESLSELRVIHVAGTKGKGSTCAFTESILRATGLRTGLFTSPHLFHVRERFRFNGVEVSEECFTRNFWFCLDRLKAGATAEVPIPGFFRFMTLLCLKMFISEKVDVAILEVGLGGRLDATNVVAAPVVCGITSLGFDHMELLGNTLAEIAGEKAGIFKAGVPAITAPQREEAMAVLQRKAQELKIPLEIAPSLESYGSYNVPLGLRGEHQRINASLAVALCRCWAQRTGQDKLWSMATENDDLPESYLVGLARTQWPGRGEIIPDISVHGGEKFSVNGIETHGTTKLGGIQFYLDGAHSPESTEACAQWFCSEVEESFMSSVVQAPDQGIYAQELHNSDNASPIYKKINLNIDSPFRRVLLFNCMPRRDPKTLLPPLINVCSRQGLPLHMAFFVPPASSYNSVDSISVACAKNQKDLSWQLTVQKHWESIWEARAKDFTGASVFTPNGSGTKIELLSTLATESQTVCRSLGSSSAVMESLAGTLDWLRVFSRRHPRLQIQVLVTGSLYLVSDMLKLLKR